MNPVPVSMNIVPAVPASAPFNAEQRAWLNGYLAGLFASAEPETSNHPQSAPAERRPLLILFGSQTGTAEQLAKRLAQQSESRGFAPLVLELNAYSKVDWKQFPTLLIISSTWGDGDPPDNAAAFWSWLNSDPAPNFQHLAYSVLALGDRNYSEFCGAGKKFDQRLEQLGARRIYPRSDCDTDYEPSAQTWMDGLWPALQPATGVPPVPPPAPALTVAAAAPAAEAGLDRTVSYSRNNPFPARLLVNRKLNGASSEKDTRHFEIALDEYPYQAGDALGVVPSNCPVLVEEILAALHFKGEETVNDPSGKPLPIHEALLRQYSITQPTPALLEAAFKNSERSDLLSLLVPENKAALAEWVRGRDVVDVLRAASCAFSPDEFVALLRKLQPRLYSISSSPKAHPGQVHLTVAVVRYQAHGRPKKGVCSCYLADRVPLHDAALPVFVQPSHGFRLPAAPDAPMIMIGPGTGIAPFRAFLHERRATGATGKNWLFFGDQHRACDFLYQSELEQFQNEGLLTRLDTAFSRDQAEKIYVQHRMLEHAHDLWEWLENGAHLYVCGDAQRMAKDVDAALRSVIETAGQKTPDQAAEYVAQLKSEHRYQRDVY